MQKVVQKAECRVLFLWNMSCIFSILYEFLQRSCERLIMFPRAFDGPFRVLVCTEKLFAFMPTGQQTVDALGRVLQTVLVEHPSLPGQAHTGKTVILGDDNISRLRPVDHGKVHTVGTLIKKRVSALSRSMRCTVVQRIFTGTLWGRLIRTVRPTTGHPSASIKIVDIMVSFLTPLIGGFSMYNRPKNVFEHAKRWNIWTTR